MSTDDIAKRRDVYRLLFQELDMIEGMNKLKARAMRRLGARWVRGRNDREATSPPSDAGTALRHPLLGALKGFVRVMPGTDLTKPADPDWGKQ